jgi:hypothetical protein
MANCHFVNIKLNITINQLFNFIDIIIIKNKNNTLKNKRMIICMYWAIGEERTFQMR